jgi:hypothetical protein
MKTHTILTKASSKANAAFSWLKNNPLKSFASFIFVAVGIPALNTLFQEVFVPSLMPLNVVTDVSAENPSSKGAYSLGNGEVMSPIELNVTIKNPGRRKIYLLRSVWTAEVCKLVPKQSSGADAERVREVNEAQFFQEVEINNNPWASGFAPTYQGLERICKFVGMGSLVPDNSISPGEEISSKLVIAYPPTVQFYGGGEIERVDYIKLVTYVPSTTSTRPDLSYRLKINSKQPQKAPRTIELWAKKPEGKLDNNCVIQGSYQPRKDEVVTTTDKIQVWCKLQQQVAEKQGVILTRSINETWLADRRK